ncbi:transposase, partial [Sphingomonas sp. NPDC019816]|uniref:transposase n=1 Tax=Sphingomonas sp. NPDC019816 TaxID=3390679 RepID=UPI003CFE612B
MGQITVMTGPERRRRWSDEERLQILAEAFAPGASVLAVARRHDISTARIYTWRSKLRQPPALTEFAEAVVDDGAQQGGQQAGMPVIIIDLGAVNRRAKRTPYRRPKGTPFVEQRDGYGGCTV